MRRACISSPRGGRRTGWLGYRAAPGRNRVRLLLAAAVVLLALFVVGCGPDEMTRERIGLGDQVLTVWVAETPDQRSEGLQAVPPLTDGEGMLFAWEEPGDRVFEIKDVSYPIDVIFIDEFAIVVDVDTIGPDGEDTASSGQDILWVVEVPAGWAETYGVAEGSKLVLREGR